MHTAILISESQSALDQIIEMAQKLNVKTTVISEESLDDLIFLKASESALQDWLTPEEDDAWKNL